MSMIQVVSILITDVFTMPVNIKYFFPVGKMDYIYNKFIHKIRLVDGLDSLQTSGWNIHKYSGASLGLDWLLAWVKKWEGT